MKNNRAKKMMAVLAAVMIFGRSVPVYAASPVTGNLGGFTVTGSTSFASTVATASTTLSRAATLEASVRGYYWSGTTLLHTDSGTNTASGGGVSAHTYVSSPDSFVGSKGQHYAAFGGYTWTATSETGVVRD
jgi:hypothetical protein